MYGAPAANTLVSPEPLYVAIMQRGSYQDSSKNLRRSSSLLARRPSADLLANAEIDTPTTPAVVFVMVLLFRGGMAPECGQGERLFSLGDYYGDGSVTDQVLRRTRV